MSQKLSLLLYKDACPRPQLGRDCHDLYQLQLRLPSSRRSVMSLSPWARSVAPALAEESARSEDFDTTKARMSQSNTDHGSVYPSMPVLTSSSVEQLLLLDGWCRFLHQCVCTLSVCPDLCLTLFVSHAPRAFPSTIFSRSTSRLPCWTTSTVPTTSRPTTATRILVSRLPRSWTYL